MATIETKTNDQKEFDMKECLLSGKDRHFSKFYDNYAGVLLGQVMKWIKDSEAAENVLQDVFVKAWRCRQLYDPSKGKVFTWLYNITRNICIDHLRSKAYRQSKVSLFTDDMPALVRTKSQDCLRPDTIGLRKLVSMLREEEKQVLELMYFNGFTQTEIAELINAPLGTVKTRMSRAMKNLRYQFRKDLRDGMRMISLN